MKKYLHLHTFYLTSPSMNQQGREDEVALWKSWAQGRVISQSPLTKAPRCSPLLPSQPGEMLIASTRQGRLWSLMECNPMPKDFQANLHSVFYMCFYKRNSNNVFLRRQRWSVMASHPLPSILTTWLDTVLGQHWQTFPAQSLHPEKAGRERVKTSPPQHLKRRGKEKNLICFTLMVREAALPNISRRKYESEILRELLQQHSSLHNPHILNRALRNLIHMVYLHHNVGQSRVRPYVRLSNDKSLAHEQLFVLE